MHAHFTDYLSRLETTDPHVYRALLGEQQRQRDGIELIPSENYTDPEVLALLGSVFTNKYSEGYPGRRYYGGQEFTDTIENFARNRACELFRGEHANVQPLSGSAMNQAVYLALLEPGDTILAMDLSHGGHLTHGAPVSHMGSLFRFIRYRTDPASGAIDYEGVRELALQHRPKLLLCGYSSYPGDMDYRKFKAIADEAGALTMADISHIGGLVAGKVMQNPLDAGFDVITTTTHKSLRGPRGGLIVCKEEFGPRIDKSVFPGLQGGPHMNQVAATATTLLLASRPAFRDYCQQVLDNARALASALAGTGAKLVTGGTKNHLMVVDTMSSFGLTGKQAEHLLNLVGITTNKQVLPDDPLPPLTTSGIRLGTPAATTRGMVEADMEQIAAWICETLRSGEDERALGTIATKVRSFCQSFPVPGL
ncbi:serine hydroxymethyltransferase [Gilvimarinus sp. F26214L]|uniref:serine hydroxymethyltransferase n=1 Tax=Gilvimarinus sp. DZF01 TaxID=3461371 RepID=UPI0040454BBF